MSESDLFEDTEVSTETTSKEVEQETSEKEVETKVEKEKEDKDTEVSQGEENAEPPSATEEEKETQSEKMIPEHRFKAAVKDVTEKLNKAEQELAQLKATPAPDREADPDGYELHVRIETSKEIMRAIHDDYDETIAHYQELAKENPYLNNVVASHKTPAKHAYDIAKKDLEIKELSNLKNSEEWKEFQEFKANKNKKAIESQTEVKSKQVKVIPKVPPNLNRATDVSRGKQVSSDDTEELFKGAL